MHHANALNQYVSVASDEATVVPVYDADGNLVTFGGWSYAYDSAQRLTEVRSNGVLVASNSYDHMGRRVRLVTPDAVHTFFYDGWNVILELIEHDGITDRIEYYWGKDISGDLQSAGGVSGLLYLKRNGSIFVPIYDANGNVMEYRAADGSLAASYVYDSFGRTISQTGSLADVFRFRYSTKSFDVATGLYYFGKRFYSPELHRWLNRDPIEEKDGGNMYAFCRNMTTFSIDVLGLKRWVMIYYEKQGLSTFKRAAETLKRDIESKSTFRSGCDKVIMKSVTSTGGFASQWNAAKSETDGNDPNLKVEAVHLFTHSGPSRLYFLGGSTTSRDISQLPKLNWADGGGVVCHGCNSGLQSWDDISVAEAFSNGQGVMAEGQTGYSQFSTSEKKRTIFTRVSDSSESVYLWSYGDGGKDFTFGDQRKPKVFGR